MKYFDIPFTPKKNFKRYRRFINIPFLVLTIGAFLIFSVYSTIAGLLFSDNKSDVFSQDLQELAIYFRPIDTNFSSFLLTLDSVVQDYIAGENVFKTRKEEIEEVWLYISENREYLTAL
jgi:CRISPR/Cas system-associated protein endoribonuclease Cas2